MGSMKYTGSLKSSSQFVKNQKFSNITIFGKESVDREYWNDIIDIVERKFTQNSLPNFTLYDTSRPIKLDRSKLFENAGFSKFDGIYNRKYRKLLSDKTVSDHSILNLNDIVTWNILHHYSYNSNHEYLSTKKIHSNIQQNFQFKMRVVLPEEVRYNYIVEKILTILENQKVKVFALQECEFCIYKKIVSSIGDNYFSRFIPHRISYGKNGLEIESFGCALFILNEKNRKEDIEVFVKGYPKSRQDHEEKNYKYLIIRKKNIAFSSIHFPCFRSDNEKIWTQYFYEDIKNMYHSFSGIEKFYIIGDLNIEFKNLKLLLDKIDYIGFNIIASQGVDYLIETI